MPSMKKPQNNSTLAATLRIALALALVLTSATLITLAETGPIGTKASPISMETVTSTPTPTPTPCSSASWSPTGSMVSVRDYHTAITLSNGKVLVVGGFNGGVASSTELYDPATGNWSATGSLGTARELHTATLLPSG